MHDVVIVGASLAGASTALHLARAGHRVLLLDRASFPRRKGCGEGLFPAGVGMLNEMGLLECLLPRSRVLESLRLDIDGRSAEAAMGGPRYPALGIRRELLDAALLEQAQAAGVEARLGVKATGLTHDGRAYTAVKTNRGDVSGRVILLADGLRSSLRRVAGLDAKVSGGRYGVSGRYSLAQEPPPRVHIRMLRGHEVYVTPVGGDVVNVAVLMGKQRAKALGGRLVDAYEAMVRHSGVVPGEGKLIDPPLASGPFPAQALSLWQDNLLLAGDAAGFFDGISGEGMSLALVASRQAAAAVDAFLADGDAAHFRAYERSRRRLARNSELLARVSLLLGAYPRLGRWAIGNLGKQPATFEKVLAINAGTVGLASLRPRDVLALVAGR